MRSAPRWWAEVTQRSGVCARSSRTPGRNWPRRSRRPTAGVAQLAIIPPKDAAKIIEEVMPTLPAEVGGGSSKVLTQGFRWAAVGLDAPKLKLSLTIQASDADAAKALLDLLSKTCAAIGKDKQVRELLPDFDKLTQLLTPKVAGDRLTLTLDDEALMSALRPLIPKAAQASDRVRSENNLKQLAPSRPELSGRLPQVPRKRHPRQQGQRAAELACPCAAVPGRGKTL